jgi:hypothetical protein
MSKYGSKAIDTSWPNGQPAPLIRDRDDAPSDNQQGRYAPTQTRTHRVALSATNENGGGRDLHILDPRTGELLVFEMTAVRNPGRPGITEAAVLDSHPVPRPHPHRHHR